MMSLLVFLTNQVSAQFPCDITSGGVELRNGSGFPIPHIFVTGAQGFATFGISNQGVGAADGSPCAYPIGKVEVKVSFPASAGLSYFFKYDGPMLFSTAKYNWAYSTILNALVGINTQPIPTGFIGAEVVSVPISALATGTTLLGVTMRILPSASGDFAFNNAFDMPVVVLAGAGGVLPVTLTNFEAFADKCNAKIKWSTSNETNLKKYEVEVSKNGLSFEKAGTLNPSVANTGIYEFNTNQGTGKAYYRLKIIDKDGSVTYSKIVTVNANCTDKIVKLFPNPVKLDQLLNVNLTGYDASVKADLYSSTGQLVKSYILKNGANNLSVENLAQGFYTLRVMENGAVAESFKLNVLK